MRALFGIFLLASLVTSAQQLGEPYGKSRIQYEHFNWRYYSSENFNIYFYDGGANMAKQTAAFLETQFDRVTDVIGYLPYYKTNIFLYNSHQDYLQSNVGVREQIIDVSGQVDVVKPQIEIAYSGTHQEFKDELIYKLSMVIVNEMLFGGSISEIFQNAYLLELPDWFTRGVAMYVAGGWGVGVDDFSRVFLRDNKDINLANFNGDEAAWIGYSFWNYLANEYGQGAISNILNLTRIIRNEEKSISRTLVRPFDMILADWRAYYLNLNQSLDDSYDYQFWDDTYLDIPNKKEITYFKLSPAEKNLAYVIHRNGKSWIRIRNLESGEDKQVYKSGNILVNQDEDYEAPLIAWSDENTLGIVDYQKSVTTLYVYELSSDSKLAIPLPTIEQVVDFTVAPNRSLAIISANRGNQNDLYLTTLRRPALKRLTSDPFDDINPTFLPGTNRFIFSSNRTTDSLVNISTDLKSDFSSYNLFLYDLDTTRQAVYRLTNTLDDDIQPQAIDTDNILYLSDQKGIYNLYRFQIQDNITTQLTNNPVSISQFQYAQQPSRLFFTLGTVNQKDIYARDPFDLSTQNFTLQTKRQNLELAKYLARRKANERLQKEEEERRELKQKSKKIRIQIDSVKADSSLLKSDTSIQVVDSSTVSLPPKQEPDSGFIDIDNYVFESEALSTLEEEELDTDNFIFDSEIKAETKKQTSFLSKYKSSKADSKIFGPSQYVPTFVTDNIVTNIVFDPLRGGGTALETQMNDQLENHHFFGGMVIYFDFNSSDFYAGYQYLKDRVDYQVSYRRKSIQRRVQAIGSSINQKYILNEIEGSLQYPLTPTSRISLNPFLTFTNFIDYDDDLLTNPQIIPGPPLNNDEIGRLKFYPGLRGEFILDNTVSLGMNLTEGTKGRGTLSYAFGSNGSSFGNFEMDLRNYQSIFKNFIFASRLFYGRFFGPSPKDYLSGGVHNWVTFNPDNLINNPDLGNPLEIQELERNEDLVFARFTTPLRGYYFNQVNGNQAAVLNGELRLPVIDMLYSGSISNNFFRNLQIVGFYDIGLSWSTGNPFSVENDINRTTFRNDARGIIIELQSYQNPWLTSAGYGFRSVLLNFYVKLDFAYPLLQNQDLDYDRMIHLSLGYDF